MSDMKKYVLTALTLGLIAASGALLIAGTNMITKDTIAANEKKSINNGIATIYGDVSDTEEISLAEGKEYTYTTTCYKVIDSNAQVSGYAFRTDGSNNYGKISLIIGFNNEKAYKGLSVITNEQSFASTLKKGYIDVIKNGDKTVDDTDVSCGATYGAKLVRAMVKDAEQAVKDLIGGNNG